MHRRVRHLNPAQCGAQIALDARFITGVADGAAVSSWPARANSTITADQVSGTSQPIFRANAIGGRPAVDFDGSNDIMFLSAAALSLTNNVGSADLLAVCVQDETSSDTSCTIVFFSHGANGSASRINFLGRSFGSDGLYSSGRRTDADSLVTSASAGTLTSPIVAEARFRWSSGNTLAVVNGVAGSAANFSSGSGSTSASDSLAATLGAVSVATNRFNGKISAVIFGVPAFSDAVRRRIRHSLGFSFRIATH